MSQVWETLNPVRRPTGNLLYNDIISHAKQPVLDESIETNAHESTHRVNSDLRQIYTDEACVYCLNGHFYHFKEPAFKKKDIIQFIPEYFRHGECYNLYIMNVGIPTQWIWTNALYPLDEYSAYMNGSEAGMEYEIMVGPLKDNMVCVKNAIFMAAYASAILRCVDKYDPNYPDKSKLQEFVGWGIERTLGLAEKAKQHPNFHAQDLEQCVEAFKQELMNDK